MSNDSAKKRIDHRVYLHQKHRDVVERVQKRHGDCDLSAAIRYIIESWNDIVTSPGFNFSDLEPQEALPV